ncbi:PREDICTED: zinc metalloproteinase nas-4 isoform X3 [Trachymyrmex cornetzi]|uniref:zinc metalloproteinase nas-4 isoform X3 n=1 Tax=Trachymyrmex cornetzi TaxID=471704 RepID=UPI00084F0E46|nr:PREDICTED: zinc metalloproteinase nas-4 isoform X3 [Trachymyrmex cornetzi]
MFVIRSRKMQLKAQCLRGLFSLTLVLLLRSWFVTNINAYPVQLINPWIIRPLQMLPRMMKTRKSTHSPFISYRLDSWSQYNNPEEGAQREGDIRRKSRKTITTDKTLLWPNGIVKYYVHSSIVNEPLKFIMLETALQMIMSKTCIKFVRIDDYAELLANGSWVNITGHDEGCYSDIGCVYHEHMRPDRDKYISIIWENMKKGDEFNFELLNNSVVTDYGLPYDYDSIMHYSMTAFSTDRSLPTIIPKNFYVEIGQRNHLSYYDIQKLQIAYNCDTVSINKLKKEPLNKPKKLKKLPKSKKLQDTTVVGRKINQECPPLL